MSTSLTLAPASADPFKFNPAVDPKSIFPFLFLPVEIRLQIYGLLFKLDTPVVLQPEFHETGRITFRRHEGELLAMALANKQLSQEVTHFLYSNNSFAIRDPVYFRDWLIRIGPRNASLIPEVIVIDNSWDVEEDDPWPTVEQADKELHSLLFALQKHSPNLQAITVHSREPKSNIVQSLDRFSTIWPMRMFSNLQRIAFQLCKRVSPVHQRQFYEKFFLRSRLPITVSYKAATWGDFAYQFRPNPPPGEADVPRYGLEGDVWLRLTFDTMGERLAATPEAKKWAARRRKEAEREARLESNSIQGCGASG
jgi:hypothetical protein